MREVEIEEKRKKDLAKLRSEYEEYEVDTYYSLDPLKMSEEGSRGKDDEGREKKKS